MTVTLGAAGAEGDDPRVKGPSRLSERTAGGFVGRRRSRNDNFRIPPGTNVKRTRSRPMPPATVSWRPAHGGEATVTVNEAWI